jgi:hypothetical protein
MSDEIEIPKEIQEWIDHTINTWPLPGIGIMEAASCRRMAEAMYRKMVPGILDLQKTLASYKRTVDSINSLLYDDL